MRNADKVTILEYGDDYVYFNPGTNVLARIKAQYFREGIAESK